MTPSLPYPPVFSKTYPPRHRVPSTLGPVDIEIVDKVGVFRLDVTRAAVAAHSRKLPLAAPGHTSFLSGQPAFLYRNAEGVELALTEDELLRLLRAELQPDEYRKIRSHYGVFHAIHDDFYDEATGQALQPMGQR